MHETDRWYRYDDGDGLRRAGYALFWVMVLLIPSLSWSQGQPESGRPIYEQNCANCHGADGRGGPMGKMMAVPPRDLSDRGYMETRTAEQLFEVIKKGGGAQGLSAAMPGFGGRLSDEQVWDTVAYVRTLAAETTASGSQPSETMSVDVPAGDIGIQYLRVSIWPEYDDPRVLVIVRGELTPESSVPTRIKLPIPKGAGLLGAGMISGQNQLLNHPHQILTGDTSDTLELTLPVRRFFAEWYYDPLGERKPKRQFTYALTLPYAVAQLAIDFLQPDAATEFRTEPAATREEVNAQGGRHYRFEYQDVAPETAHTFKIAYIKTTDEPSVAKPQTGPNAQPTGPSRETKTWIAFAMLAGCAVIFAGGALVLKNKQPPPPTTAATATPASPPTADQPPVTTQNFCSNCGRQLDTNYRFCPGCGRPLSSA